MFFGTTTAPVRNFFATDIRRRAPKRVFEPFAGIFMISQITGMVDKKIRVESSEVSMYSCGIGFGLANMVAETLTLKEECLELFPGFRGSLSPEQKAAIMIFLSEAAVAASKAHKVVYYQRLLTDMQNRHREYVSDIQKQVSKAQGNLGDFQFRATDGVQLINEAEGPDDLVFYDPPFFMGDYEKMFKELGKWWNWVDIPYTEITPALKTKQLEDLRDRGVRVLYRCNDKLDVPGYTQVFEAEYKYNGWFYVYASQPEAVALMRNDRMKPKQAKMDVATTADEFTRKSKVCIVPAESGPVNHFRLMWTKKAVVRSMGSSFLVTVDGKVCGVITINSGLAFGMTYILIVADAASTFTRYKKLSKLILLLILTEEFLKFANDFFVYELDGFTTIAYSNEPVSMKYRGLFDLVERKENDESGHRYKLSYRTKDMRAKTMREAYLQWFDKYGGDTKKEKDSGKA